MKIDDSRVKSTPAPKKPFAPALGEAKARPQASRAPRRALSPSMAAPAARPVQSLREIRRAHDTRSSQLVSDRSEGLARNLERTSARLEDLVRSEVRHELAREESPIERPQPPSHAVPGAPVSGPIAPARQAPVAEGPAARPAASADALLALCERIDWMLKAGRPALAVSVGGGLDAEVEVQRTGKDEVALTVVGKRGSVDARVLSQLRDALGARGLRLSALRAG